MTAPTPPDRNGDLQSHATGPDGNQAVYATADVLVGVDRSGKERWRYDFGPRGKTMGNTRTSCVYSGDGAVVWLYRPDMYVGRSETDRWIALDAATGTVLGEAALPVPGGHGAIHYPHPDGVHMLLDVGCGQDGTYTFLGRINRGHLDWSAWPTAAAPMFGNLSITDLSADGRHVLAVSFDDGAVTVIDFPSGTVAWRLDLADFGFDLERDRLETVFVWDARFLDERTALIACNGETGGLDEDDDEPDWAASGVGECADYVAFHVVDVASRRLLGPADATGARDGDRPRFLPGS
ncbi:PQQ-binding-like beta-propeller repeat protein [Glycomyces sp. A-F 0318]|uniref:outer membrane protein assembly factor BamB family protein n=1 Tax=Glycomyces amatae TaxID=2881355 RepID=UPI001E47D556|nr:PQQ-binding-like beta-propeller repeat protein [Glycomyces amatae]MCD0446348.1 PQQ-binding-like beta-propeller repeat protein [Glycomyces amatae]